MFVNAETLSKVTTKVENEFLTKMRLLEHQYVAESINDI